MTTSVSRKAPNRNLLIALAVLMVAAAVGLILFVKGCEPGEDDKSKKPEPLTKEKLERYKVGDLYRTVVNTTVSGQVEAKDWGVNGVGTILYLSELDILREVLPPDNGMNEDTDVKLELNVQRARDLVQKFKLEDVKFDLPPIAGNMLVLADMRIKQLAVATRHPLAIATTAALGVLRKEWVRGAIIDFVDSAIKAKTGKSLGDVILPPEPMVGQFEGKKATFVYRADEGLKEFESDGSLSHDDEERLKEFSVFAESYILPAPDGKEGDEWNVPVETIAHLVAPASTMEATGNLVFRRGETKDGDVRLDVVKGEVNFMASDDKRATTAQWKARGTLYYNLAQNTVVEGKLSGAVSVLRDSKDHILFEEKWLAEPDYVVTIIGLKSHSRESATADIDPGELKRFTE